MCWRFIRLRSCFCELSGTSTKPHAYLRSRSVRLGSSLICAPYLFKGHAFRVDSGLTVRRALFAVRRSCDAEHRRGCRAPPRRYFVTLESSTPYGYDLNTHSAEPANQRNPGDTHELALLLDSAPLQGRKYRHKVAVYLLEKLRSTQVDV